MRKSKQLRDEARRLREQGEPLLASLVENEARREERAEQFRADAEVWAAVRARSEVMA